MAMELIFQKVLDWLQEDVGIWDETSRALFGEDLRVTGRVVSNSWGVVACVSEIRDFLSRMGFEVTVLKKDGDEVKPKDVVMEIRGDTKRLFELERLVLNLLAHASGVATETKKLVDVTKDLGVKVAATRKTLPGLRYFEKRAVLIGGGDPHRFNLDDSILIKDNHIKVVGSVEEAIRRAKSRASFVKKVEVEVSSPEEALEAARAGADIIMLDNVTPEAVKSAVRLLEEAGLRGKVVLEVSGGIRLENAREYASTGVDVLSSGYITISAQALDFSMEVSKC